jgi:hypothetical protein
VTSDGGVYFYFGGSVQVQGGYDVTTGGSTTLLDGAVADFSGTVSGVGSTLAVDGSADFHGTALSVADLTLGGPQQYVADATLTAGDITVTDRFDWLSGTVNGPGTALTIALPASLLLSQNWAAGGVFWQLDGRALNNYGTATVVFQPTGNVGQALLLSGGAAFNNHGASRSPPSEAIATSRARVLARRSTIMVAGW